MWKRMHAEQTPWKGSIKREHNLSIFCFLPCNIGTHTWVEYLKDAALSEFRWPVNSGKTKISKQAINVFAITALEYAPDLKNIQRRIWITMSKLYIPWLPNYIYHGCHGSLNHTMSTTPTHHRTQQAKIHSSPPHCFTKKTTFYLYFSIPSAFGATR